MKVVQFIIALFLVGIGFYFGSAFTTRESMPKAEEISQSITPPSQKTTSNRRPIDPVTVITNIEQHTINLFESTAPSVAFITTKGLQRNYYSRNITEVPTGSGSGFVWDTEGHIVTNYHVVKDGQKWDVTLGDQSTWEAELVGYEARKDLAVLKIKAPKEQLKPIQIGSSYDLKVGQSVFAIGNPFGLDQSLSTGIISALGREIESVTRIPIRDVIQCDAAINPGNSGGPLLDSSGRLIGVNTAIYSPSGASAGIGFSIPVDIVNWVVPDLVEFGEVRRPILGVELVPAQYADRFNIKGAMIMAITPGGSAAKAGLLPIIQGERGQVNLGDIITKVGPYPISNNNDLILSLEHYSPGDTVSISILREEGQLDKQVVLGSNM
jgi:S1-C subfamily serine protease